MFDNYYVKPATSTHYVDRNININEHKAPTDDSIRIYKELLDKARNEVLGGIETDNSIVGAKALLFQDFSSDSYVCKYVFNLNGNEIRGDIKINSFRLIEKYNLVRLIHEELSKDISLKVVKLLSNDLNQGIKS